MALDVEDQLKLAIAYNRDVPEGERLAAIKYLSVLYQVELAEQMLPLFMDAGESVRLRAYVVSEFGGHWPAAGVEPLIAALADPSLELRFQALNALYDMNLQQQVAIDAVLPVLDELVVSGEVLPNQWPIGRQALPVFERIYYNRLLDKLGLAGEKARQYDTVLLSPLPEYGRFITATVNAATGFMFQPLAETTDLDVDAAKFARLLERKFKRWANFALDARDPRPTHYRLSWQMGKGNKLMIGGLLEDGFTVVQTGKYKAVAEFATWYRLALPARYPLWIYDWSSNGFQIKPAMAQAQIANAQW